MRYVGFFLAVLCFISCGKEKPPVQEYYCEEIGNIKISDVIEDYTLIKLETTDDNLIVDPTVVKFSKDRIFILDMFSPTKSLYVFGRDGKYVGKVGNRGNGPGEYIMPFYFLLDEACNRIYLQDVATKSMLVYALDTFEFIDKYAIPFNANSFELLDDEHFVWYVEAGMRNEGDYQKHIQITDRCCVPQASMIERMDLPTRGMYNVPTCFARIDNAIYFHHPFMGDYYRLPVESVPLKTSFSLRFEKHSFPTAGYLKEHKESVVEDLRDEGYIQWCDVLDISSSSSLYCFGRGTDVYFGKYDKQQNTGWYINRKNIIDDLGIGMLARPKMAGQDFYVSFISMESVELSDLPETSILRGVISEREAGGNPIVVLYK